MREFSSRHRVHSWSFGYAANANVVCISNENELFEVLDYARKQSLCVALMGGANSFGDNFLSNENIILDLSTFTEIKNFNEAEGLITVAGGALIKDILRLVMLKGWFLNGVSGSINNTVAGALSADVHGKDSWKWGNFSNHIVSLKLLTAKGIVVEASPFKNTELFRAVAGGLGLLGIIVEVTLRLSRISSLFVKRVNYKARNLEDTYQLLYPTDGENFDFAFTWTDGFAHGTNCGRGIVETGKFITHDIPNKEGVFVDAFSPISRIGGLKPPTFWKILKPIWEPTFLKIFNQGKYHFSHKVSKEEIMPYPIFNFPWAKMPDANQSFYPLGFREYQAAFDKKVAGQAIKELLVVCKKFNHYPMLSSIKRHSPSSGYLSFSAEGLSVTINFLLKHFTKKELESYTNALIDVTMKYGGVVYLAKFSDLPKDIFHIMYPTYAEFEKQKKKYDPQSLFWSDTAQKLLNR